MTYSKTSEIFLQLSRDKNLPPRISYQYILDTLGLRAFGILVIFFSLPSLIPLAVIPGFSFIFSLPIALFALEVFLGRKSLWLPKSLAEKTVSQTKISHMIEKAIPYLIKLERLAKPRGTFMTSLPFDRINALVILCLALFLMLPIPFSNFIFGSLLILFSLGIMEKDGLLLTLAYLLTFLYGFFIFSILSQAFAILI